MAVNKINSRSPYYIVAAGTEGSTIGDSSETQEERDAKQEIYKLNIVQVVSGSNVQSPGSGTSGTEIKLRAIPSNFTGNGVYTWTGGNAAAAGTTADIDFKETLGGGVNNQEFSYGCSTLDADGNTITATAFIVSWANTTQYTATLTLTNNILPSISSRGYSANVTLSSSIQAQRVDILQKLQTETFTVKGRAGDNYSFAIDTLVDTPYFSGTISKSPATHSGTFGSANVALASTLSGTLTEVARYSLARSVTSSTEGCPFTINLYTSNVPDNTLVPFTITGVSANDLVRGSLTGAFQVYNNGATQTFEAKLDSTAELPSETFTITLNNIPNTGLNVSQTSVTIFDAISAGTPQEIQVSVTGKDTPGCACAETTRQSAYFRLLSGQTSIGNGVFLFSNEALTTPYSSSGEYYNIVVSGTTYVGRIGATCGGRLSEFRTCNGSDKCGGAILETNVNEALISQEYVTQPGSGGSDVCDLVADYPVYYVGSILGDTDASYDDSGATLYTYRSSVGHLSNPYAGTNNWYKIQLTGTDGSPVDFYCQILGVDQSLAGWARYLTPCEQSVEEGEEGGTTSQTNANAKVTISMSTSDGNNQGKAYVSQQTTLSATSQNISNPSYQWSKADSGGSLAPISGETSQQLIINKTGGGGETQTSTGTKIYNCSVSGTSAASNLQIVWENRTAYSLKYHTSGSANSASCTGTSITLYADRNGANEFCLATAFFSDATGQTLATGGRSYSNSTNGSNKGFRYITSSPYSLGSCANNDCTTPSQPTSGTIHKIAVTRCPNQTNAGATEYMILKDFSYGEGTVLKFKDFGQSGGAGCYTITNVYADSDSLPTPYYTVENADKLQYLETLQPFGDCTECVGEVETTEPDIIDPNKFYGAYRLCGVPEGSLQYIVSDSELSYVFRNGNATNTCKFLAISGDEAFDANATEFDSNAQFFNDCATCLGGTTPSSTGLTNKRVYQLCTDNSETLVVGTSNATYIFPDVIKYQELSYHNPQSSSAATVINVEDLLTYRDCTAANYVPPTIIDDRPSGIKVMRISLTSASNSTAACNTLYAYGLNVYYVGTFGDNTYLYSDNSLSTLYAPTTETNFRINENRSYFRIGYTGNSAGVRPGAVYNFGSCSSVDIY